MKKINISLLLCGLIGLLAFNVVNEPIVLVYPSTWDKPHYDFDKNPLTASKIELGRRLFYDPILSANNSTSCASCHLSFTAFAHTDHALSHGIHDSIGTRNAPTLINLAWSKHFMWDGAVNHLDVQALAPITHPSEMGEEINHVIEKLQQTENYPIWFKNAFGSKKITGEHLLKALSQFQLTFISADSKYDQVKNNTAEFNSQEENGYKLFQQHCNNCHQEPQFTNHSFESNGLPADSILMDLGRFVISKNTADSFNFKVPTLRNVEFSYPYMHDGRFNTLYEVLDHYTEVAGKSKYVGKKMKEGILLSKNEKVDLIAFLY